MIMKKLIFCFLGILFVVSSEAQQFRIATYNIRHKLPADTGSVGWDKRKIHIVDLIKFHEFDIFGIQEGYNEQLIDMKNMMPDFDYIGVGREDGIKGGEHTAIFYNRNIFELLDNGTFWLSDKDHSLPNIGWDAAVERICTWGIFKLKNSGKKLILMNTHFDHRGNLARLESAKLLLKMSKKFANNLPVIFTGDFNFSQNDEPYRWIVNGEMVQDCYELAEFRYAPNSTFNGFGKRISDGIRIDHIFISKSLTVKKYGILTDTYLSKFPSDHFPVMAEINFN